MGTGCGVKDACSLEVSVASVVDVFASFIFDGLSAVEDGIATKIEGDGKGGWLANRLEIFSSGAPSPPCFCLSPKSAGKLPPGIM